MRPAWWGVRRSREKGLAQLARTGHPPRWVCMAGNDLLRVRGRGGVRSRPAVAAEPASPAVGGPSTPSHTADRCPIGRLGVAPSPRASLLAWA